MKRCEHAIFLVFKKGWEDTASRKGRRSIQQRCKVMKLEIIHKIDESCKRTGGFACQPLCGHSLRRPHLTCLVCRIRRVYYGKMSSTFKARMYRVLLRIRKDKEGRLYADFYELTAIKGRRFEKQKTILMEKLLKFCGRHPTLPQQIKKRLFTICELLAN